MSCTYPVTSFSVVPSDEPNLVVVYVAQQNRVQGCIPSCTNDGSKDCPFFTLQDAIVALDAIAAHDSVSSFLILIGNGKYDLAALDFSQTSVHSNLVGRKITIRHMDPVSGASNAKYHPVSYKRSYLQRVQSLADVEALADREAVLVSSDPSHVVSIGSASVNLLGLVIAGDANQVNTMVQVANADNTSQSVPASGYARKSVIEHCFFYASPSAPIHATGQAFTTYNGNSITLKAWAVAVVGQTAADNTASTAAAVDIVECTFVTGSVNVPITSTALSDNTGAIHVDGGSTEVSASWLRQDTEPRPIQIIGCSFTGGCKVSLRNGASGVLIARNWWDNHIGSCVEARAVADLYVVNNTASDCMAAVVCGPSDAGVVSRNVTVGWNEIMNVTDGSNLSAVSLPAPTVPDFAGWGTGVYVAAKGIVLLNNRVQNCQRDAFQIERSAIEGVTLDAAATQSMAQQATVYDGSGTCAIYGSVRTDIGTAVPNDLIAQSVGPVAALDGIDNLIVSPPQGLTDSSKMISAFSNNGGAIFYPVQDLVQVTNNNVTSVISRVSMGQGSIVLRGLDLSQVTKQYDKVSLVISFNANTNAQGAADSFHPSETVTYGTQQTWQRLRTDRLQNCYILEIVPNGDNAWLARLVVMVGATRQVRGVGVIAGQINGSVAVALSLLQDSPGGVIEASAHILNPSVSDTNGDIISSASLTNPSPSGPNAFMELIPTTIVPNVSNIAPANFTADNVYYPGCRPTIIFAVEGDAAKAQVINPAGASSNAAYSDQALHQAFFWTVNANANTVPVNGNDTGNIIGSLDGGQSVFDPTTTLGGLQALGPFGTLCLGAYYPYQVTGIGGTALSVADFLAQGSDQDPTGDTNANHVCLSTFGFGSTKYLNVSRLTAGGLSSAIKYFDVDVARSSTNAINNNAVGFTLAHYSNMHGFLVKPSASPLPVNSVALIGSLLETGLLDPLSTASSIPHSIVDISTLSFRRNLASTVTLAGVDVEVDWSLAPDAAIWSASPAVLTDDERAHIATAVYASLLGVSTSSTPGDAPYRTRLVQNVTVAPITLAMENISFASQDLPVDGVKFLLTGLASLGAASVAPRQSKLPGYNQWFVVDATGKRPAANGTWSAAVSSVTVNNVQKVQVVVTGSTVPDLFLVSVSPPTADLGVLTKTVVAAQQFILGGVLALYATTNDAGQNVLGTKDLAADNEWQGHAGVVDVEDNIGNEGVEQDGLPPM